MLRCFRSIMWLWLQGVLQGPKERMELFTLSQAIQSLKGREEGVARFLDRRREIFGVQLRYGLREGKILSIGEMTPQERGLRCGCVCPSCGKPLLAKMGKKVRWHFAHSGTENQCNPSLAGQTAVHMLAKEILQEAKKIYLPGIEVSWRETSYSDELWEISDHLPEKKACINRGKCVLVKM